jgi:two-component system nitrogen regulation response regulator GlnG
VIAATNQNLELRVNEGQFRRDLLFRLNGFTIRLPSLRDRLEDLAPLVEYFIARFRHELNRPALTCADATITALSRHTWPGNVRELQSAIRYAIVHSQGESILPDALPESCLVGASSQAGSDSSPATGDPNLTCLVREMLASGQADVYRRALAVVDRIVLREVLDYVRGNQVQASQLLGMSRTTLRSKLAQQGVPWDELRAT